MVFCTQLGDEKIWNNPQTGGVNWRPPTIAHHADTTVAINAAVAFNAQGQDANGEITGFIWSFDQGRSWDTAVLPALQIHSWNRAETGNHPVFVRAMDNDHLLSPADTFYVSVHSYIPVISHVDDTVVSQHAAVTISVSAFDTNSAIRRFYWSTQPGAWTDSTSAGQYVFSQPQGGPLNARCGVTDSDGNWVVDSFRILFNRGASSVVLTEPASGAAAQFASYDFVKAEGSVRLRYQGTDPDGVADTLTYLLFINDSMAYSGRNVVYTAQNMEAHMSYAWKLRVKMLLRRQRRSLGLIYNRGGPRRARGHEPYTKRFEKLSYGTERFRFIRAARAYGNVFLSFLD